MPTIRDTFVKQCVRLILFRWCRDPRRFATIHATASLSAEKTFASERITKMSQEHIPVMIVGAGGAGLTLSLLLQQQGISSLLVERRPDVSWYPRARNLTF